MTFNWTSTTATFLVLAAVHTFIYFNLSTMASWPLIDNDSVHVYPYCTSLTLFCKVSVLLIHFDFIFADISIFNRLKPRRDLIDFTLTPIDFTLSNARWFYSSKGDPLGVKGLNKKACIPPNKCHITPNLPFNDRSLYNGRFPIVRP